MNKKGYKSTDELKEFLDNVPHKDYKIWRQRIAEVCKVSPAVVRFWLEGTTKIPAACKFVIENAAGMKIFSHDDD